MVLTQQGLSVVDTNLEFQYVSYQETEELPKFGTSAAQLNKREKLCYYPLEQEIEGTTETAAPTDEHGLTLV